MLGHALREALPQAMLFDVVASGLIKPVDITNLSSLQRALQPLRIHDIVINAAAYTNVDGAETGQGKVLSAESI
jgi:dTDP-4-dehydrorhamnose reductase